jgi:hypothetical protein
LQALEPMRSAYLTLDRFGASWMLFHESEAG